MPPLSPSQKYLRAYGLVGPQVSPEMAWQMKERERAGQDILNGKFGTGLPAALGLNPDGSPAGGSLGDQYQQAADAAKAATDARDKEIRGVLDQRIANSKDLFARTSGGMFSNIYRNQRRQMGAAVMNDAARGFYRSGAGNSKTAQLARHDELTQAEGEVAQKQALLDAQLQKDKADYVERINDVPPDMNQLIGLEQKMGAGNTAGIFGGNPYGAQPQGGYANVYSQPRIRDQGPSNYTTLKPEQPRRTYTLGAPGGLQAALDAPQEMYQASVNVNHRMQEGRKTSGTVPLNTIPSGGSSTPQGGGFSRYFHYHGGGPDGNDYGKTVIPLKNVESSNPIADYAHGLLALDKDYQKVKPPAAPPPPPGSSFSDSLVPNSPMRNPALGGADTAFDHELQYGLNGTRRRRSFANTYARSRQ